MERAREMRRKAEQVESLARGSTKERDRQMLKDIAEQWRDLARQVEALAAHDEKMRNRGH